MTLYPQPGLSTIDISWAQRSDTLRENILKKRFQLRPVLEKNVFEGRGCHLPFLYQRLLNQEHFRGRL